MTEMKTTKDITVSQIIATFKDKNRKLITSSIESDEFLDSVKKKSHWTIEEYKELILTYALENIYTSLFDYSAIKSVARKYNFKLDWHDHFKVIESITNVKKQTKYLNYYFWYYHSDMNEALFKELMAKPYYHLLTSKSKSTFIQHHLRIGKSYNWISNNFTDLELSNGLKLNSLHIDSPVLEKENYIQKVKDFYNQYEHLMSQNIKARFFYKAVETGLIALIKFLYVEKRITKINKVVLLWHVCSDTAQTNTLEILNCLKDLGIKFNNSLLNKVKTHRQWDYMDHKEVLLDFFEAEKLLLAKK